MKLEKTVTVTLPADHAGKSIDAPVVQDVVDHALFKAGPIVVLNHVWGAFNEFKEATSYVTAVKLAGLVMRYALENQDRRKAPCTFVDLEALVREAGNVSIAPANWLPDGPGFEASIDVPSVGDYAVGYGPTVAIAVADATDHARRKDTSK